MSIKEIEEYEIVTYRKSRKIPIYTICKINQKMNLEKDRKVGKASVDGFCFSSLILSLSKSQKERELCVQRESRMDSFNR